MQLCNTCLSSFAEIISSSHDLVGMSIIILYIWSSESVVNLHSTEVLYALGVYGLMVMSFAQTWLANSFANSSSVLLAAIEFWVFPLIILLISLYSFLVSCLLSSIRVWRE